MNFITFLKDSLAWMDYEDKNFIGKVQFWFCFPYAYAVISYFRGVNHWD